MGKLKEQYRHQKLQCVFCDNEANSEEHVYPQWAKKLLGERFAYRFHSLDSGSRERRTTVRRRTGDPRASPLRVVCTECNPNWMSQLQDQNQDLIIGIGDGSKTSLNSDDQCKLAKWAVMTTMVLGTQHPHISFPSKASRKEFGENQIIPAGWDVFVARHTGKRFESFNHFGFEVGAPDSQGVMQLIKGVGYQSTAWVVAGTFFLTSYQTPLLRAMSAMPPLAGAVHAVKIYPAQGEVDVPSISDEQADEDSRAPVGIPREFSRRQWEVAPH